VWVAFDVLGKHGGESRLADAGLARDQHHPTIAALRLLTAANKQLDFLLTPTSGVCDGSFGAHGQYHYAGRICAAC
jgi:hypothetical protein